MITFENVVEYNRIITGDGAFKRNGEVSLKQILSAPPPATISAVCQIGYLVALGQYFSDGNHRTGVLTIHLKLIEEADLVSRKKSYLIYGFLDDALALHDKGAGGNLTKLTDFIGNGGFIPLKDTPKKEEYRARYRNEKIAEVLALDALLPQIGRKPVAVAGGKEWTAESRKAQLKLNAEYKKLEVTRKAYKDVHGGTTKHWSD